VRKDKEQKLLVKQLSTIRTVERIGGEGKEKEMETLVLVGGGGSGRRR